MKNQRKIKHGGARPGAGRKEGKPTKTLSFRVPEELAPQLREKIIKLIEKEKHRKHLEIDLKKMFK